MHREIPEEADALLSPLRATAAVLTGLAAAVAGIGVMVLFGAERFLGVPAAALPVAALLLWLGFRRRGRIEGLEDALREPPIPVRLTLSLRPVREVGGEDLVATFRLLDPDAVGHTGDEERVVVGTAGGETPTWLGETVDADAFAHPDTGEYLLIRTPHGWLWGGPGEGDPSPAPSPASSETK